MQKNNQHSKNIIDLLYKTYTQNDIKYGWVDLVLVIIEGINKDLGTTYNLLNQLSFQILVAINQCDAMKGKYFNCDKNEPESRLFGIFR